MNKIENLPHLCKFCSKCKVDNWLDCDAKWWHVKFRVNDIIKCELYKKYLCEWRKW